MKHAGCLLLVLTALTGCATGGTGSPWLGARSAERLEPCAPLSSDQELTLNLSQEMFDGGRLHAALANLEGLPGTLPEVRLRKARILRLLGRSEAQSMYRSLIGTCLAADGLHGLGQLAAAGQRYEEALEHLQAAVRLAPTNHALRNDLGVVYLNMLRMDEARFELMTAMELNEQDSRTAENLLTLLIYEGKLTQASHVVNRYKLTATQYGEAGQRAQVLQQRNSKRVAEDSSKAVAVVAVPASDDAPAAAASPETQAPALRPSARAPGVRRVESSGVRPVVPITGVEEPGMVSR